jgi:hypothetical protein
MPSVPGVSTDAGVSSVVGPLLFLKFMLLLAFGVVGVLLLLTSLLFLDFLLLLYIYICLLKPVGLHFYNFFFISDTEKKQ